MANKPRACVVFFRAEDHDSDTRLGAIVMGIGVLLGVVTMILRLRASGDEVWQTAGAEAPA